MSGLEQYLRQLAVIITTIITITHLYYHYLY